MGFTTRNKKYFHTFKGYTFDRRLFWGASLLIVLIACYGVVSYGLGEDHIYLSCPEDARGGVCFNPLYNTGCSEWYCSQELLVAGFSYGEKPAFIINYFLLIVAAILAVAFMVNHQLYNKGF